MVFGEAFTAMRTAVPAASVVKDNRDAESGNISDKLVTVVMDI